MTATSIWSVTYCVALGDFSDEFVEHLFADEQSANAWCLAETGTDEYGYDLWDDHASYPVVSRRDNYDGPLYPADEYGVIGGSSTIVPDPDRDQLIVESIMSDVRRSRRIYGPSPIDPIMSDVCGRPVPEYTCWLGG